MLNTSKIKEWWSELPEDAQIGWELLGTIVFAISIIAIPTFLF